MARKELEILDVPWQWDIERLTFSAESEGLEDPYLEITFKRERELKTVRFIRPAEIKLGSSFPLSNSGMEIIDVSERQLDGINIEIGNFENSSPTITFFAHSAHVVNDA